MEQIPFQDSGILQIIPLCSFVQGSSWMHTIAMQILTFNSAIAMQILQWKYWFSLSTSVSTPLPGIWCLGGHARAVFIVPGWLHISGKAHRYKIVRFNGCNQEVTFYTSHLLLYF